MSTAVTPVIVFVDIDRVPLAIDDGHRRLPALLATLASERIMMVFCSCRTRAEIEGFRQSCGVFHPFITEHGAAAFVPGRYFGSGLQNVRTVAGYQAIEFGLPYDNVVSIVRRTADQFHIGIRGFADMSIEQVARECGLSLLDARLAKLREYGEPFRLLVEDPMAERRLLRALASSGIWCTRCGPLLYAASVPGAASAAAVLTTLYKTTYGPVITAATGGEPLADLKQAVDVDLDPVPTADRRDSGETLDWMEAIVDRVGTILRRRDAVTGFAAARLGA